MSLICKALTLLWDVNIISLFKKSAVFLKTINPLEKRGIQKCSKKLRNMKCENKVRMHNEERRKWWGHFFAVEHAQGRSGDTAEFGSHFRGFITSLKAGGLARSLAGIVSLTWLVRKQSPFVTCTGKLSWYCTRGYGDCIISTWLHRGSCGPDTLLNLSALIVRARHKSISFTDNWGEESGLF